MKRRWREEAVAVVADSNSTTVAPVSAPHGLNLTDRDLELLKVVGENGLALLEQLWLMYWQPTGGKLRTCRERLARLEHANYLSRHFLGVRGRRRGEIAFSLTAQGRDVLPTLLHSYYQVGLPSSHELRQQIMALDARIVLARLLAKEGKTIVQWLSERVVRSQVMSARLSEGGGWSEDHKIDLHPGEIPDARLLLALSTAKAPAPAADEDEGDEDYERWVQQHEELDLELDGQYTGVALGEKLEALSKLKNSVIYVYYHQHGRTARLEAALSRTSPQCQSKLRLVSIRYGPDPDDPYGTNQN